MALSFFGSQIAAFRFTSRREFQLCSTSFVMPLQDPQRERLNFCTRRRRNPGDGSQCCRVMRTGAGLNKTLQEWD